MKHFIDFGIKIETIKTKNILGEFIETGSGVQAILYWV